jgi:ParB-like chromosome segregation protein Spo0J
MPTNHTSPPSATGSNNPVASSGKPTWRDALPMPVHPAADVFPMMGDAELDDLAATIKQYGIQIPPAVWREPGQPDQLIDARNRFAALERAGIPFEIVNTRLLGLELLYGEGRSISFQVFEPSEETPSVEAVVLMLNVHRRHLKIEDKRKAIAGLLKLNPNMTDRQIAKRAKVSPSTVGSVRANVQVGHNTERTEASGRRARGRRPGSNIQGTEAEKPKETGTVTPGQIVIDVEQRKHQHATDEQNPDPAKPDVPNVDGNDHNTDGGDQDEKEQLGDADEAGPCGKTNTTAPASLREAWEKTEVAARALRRLNQVCTPQVVENLTQKMVASDPSLAGAAHDAVAVLARVTAHLHIAAAKGFWSSSDIMGELENSVEYLLAALIRADRRDPDLLEHVTEAALANPKLLSNVTRVSVLLANVLANVRERDPRPTVGGSTAARPRPSSPISPKRATHTDIMERWLAAPFEERTAFISNLGKDMFEHLPDDWAPAVEEWLSKQVPRVLN